MRKTKIENKLYELHNTHYKSVIQYQDDISYIDDLIEKFIHKVKDYK